MNDERLNTLLILLKQADVQPPLVSDSWIRSMFAPSRWLLFTLPILASLFAVIGVVYQTGLVGNNATAGRSLPAITNAVTSRTATSSASVNVGVHPDSAVSARIMGNHDSPLDPRSILTLSLTEEELLSFGIRRDDSSVTVTIQTLVVADTMQARTLDLSSNQLRDTMLLFHRSYGYSDMLPDRIVAKHLSGYRLDELSPIFVLPAKTSRKTSMLVVVGCAPALIPDSLFSMMTYAAQTMQPSAMDRTVPSASYLASLPDEQSVGSLAPSRKPILLEVSDNNNSNRFVVAVMPTQAVLDQLPKRFHGALRTCYAPFVPGHPTPSSTFLRKPRTNVGAPQTTTALTKLAGISGHPFIELTDDALRQFGLVTDDVSICSNGRSVATLDTATTTFVKARSQRTLSHYLTSLSYGPEKAVRVLDGVEFAIGSLGALNPDAGSSLEVHVSGQTDTVIRLYSTHNVRAIAIDSIPPTDWLDRYPLARTFASNVAWDIMRIGIPTDSLGYYSVRHGNLLIPVLKLLFGLRVTTPWVSRPTWNGDSRRLVSIAWYLPSQPVMNALPDHVRQFIQPEYEALYASIEHSQSITEACTLLNHPSALGFCSIGDSTVRIDGVGPIPARDVFTLYVSSDRDASASIQLVDGNGTIVQEQSAVSIRSGSNQIPVTINASLAPGAYMVILSTPSVVRRSRLLIHR